MNSQDYYAIGRSLARSGVKHDTAAIIAREISLEQRHSFKEGHPAVMILSAYERQLEKMYNFVIENY